MIAQASYVESDCTVTHEGHSFESGGAVVTDQWIIGYLYRDERTIKNWHGDTVLLHVTYLRKGKRWNPFGGYWSEIWTVNATDEAGRQWYGRCGEWDLIRMRPRKTSVAA